jgi:hypothetical protein
VLRTLGSLEAPDEKTARAKAAGEFHIPPARQSKIVVTKLDMEQEATLAKAAITNESRADHYAMAAYYTRLAEAKERLARMTEAMTGDASGSASLTK